MMSTMQINKESGVNSSGFRRGNTEIGFNDENTGNDLSTYEGSFSFEGLLNKRKTDNIDRSGDWIITELNKSKTTRADKYLSTSYLTEINRFMKEEKVSELTVNLPEEGAYVKIVQDEISEMEEGLKMLSEKLSLYKYYSIIWMISIALMSIFAVVGFAGILSPFPSISGFLASLAGMIGAYIDWKDRDHTDAS